MKLSDIYSAKALAAYFTQAHSNDIPFLGLTLMPRKKKMGLDLKWIKGHKGLPVMLKPSAFDSKSTIRDRIGVSLTKTQMAYFKESIGVDEEDEQEIMRVQESSDPYAQQVLQHIYDDTDGLIVSADVTAERMIWQILAPENGTPGVAIVANGVDYTYNYDDDGSWKPKHFVELTGTDLWSDLENSDPITDIETIKETALANGKVLTMMIVSPKTMKNLVKNKAVRDCVLAQNVTANVHMNQMRVKEVFKNELSMDIIVYEKQFKDIDGNDKFFYPDTTATFLTASVPGNTWYGTSPIERQALSSKDANVAQVNTGVNIMVTKEHDPEKTKTIVDMIALPSFENGESVYVMKVA